MDFLIFALWGVLTGAIICGGTLKKSSNQVSDAQPVSEVVTTVIEENSASVVSSSSVKVVTPVAHNMTSVAEPQEPTVIIEPFSTPVIAPEEAIQTETYSAEIIDLPEGLSSDQIMLDGEGNPLMHKVQKGEYLTQMARKYYGDYRFWPYILEVNRHLFDSPEKVQADMEIFLPNATTFDINPESLESIDKAKALIAKLVP